ncbi:unnamed protein product [Orchesella dallaii]|uniref:Uncharacterized protein n=1 Tax=Orchesella dallaii TaxID=48710 RepID=A0ABP1SA42_9HEXA
MMRSIGPTLTSLMLQGLAFDFNGLVTLLESTPLKLVHMCELKYTTDIETLPLTLAQVPHLQHLDYLHLCTNYDADYEGCQIARLVFTWVIVAYAEQIVDLKVTAIVPLQTLLRSRSQNYTVAVSGRLFTIGSTSNIAFDKLQALMITCTNREFLLHTQTPALQRLVVHGLHRGNHGDIREVKQFVHSCASPLQDLELNIFWTRLHGDDLEIFGGALHPTCEITLPGIARFKLKHTSLRNMPILARKNACLVKFPAFKTLDLTDFACENRPIAIAELTVDANEYQIMRHKAELDRGLMMRTWHASMALRYPGWSIEHAVVSEMAMLHCVWRTCEKLQRINFTLNYGGHKYTVEFECDGQTILLYTWLVVSDADTIVSLRTDTEEPFLSFESSRKYNRRVHGKVFAAGATSRAAYTRLKYLHILRPSRDFLSNSENPALRYLTIDGLDVESRPDIQQTTYPRMVNMNTLAKTFLVKFPSLLSLHFTKFHWESQATLEVEEADFDLTTRVGRLSRDLAALQLERDLLRAPFHQYILAKHPELDIQNIKL